MNVKLYLNRINYDDELKPTLKVLSNLQRAHLLSVPFENLDIHNHIPIRLDLRKIYNKIIEKKRGGFCYELNGLFYELLIQLKFEAKMVSARVYKNLNNYGPEFDHLSIIVKIDSVEYISDVGFGEFSIKPLQLNLNGMEADDIKRYFIEKIKANTYRVSKVVQNNTIPIYILNNINRKFSDFNEMCMFHQTNKESTFVKKRLVSLLTESGRITLTDRKLKITTDNMVVEEDLKSEKEFKEKLWKYFKINVEN